MPITGKTGDFGYEIDIIDRKIKMSLKFDGPGIDAEGAIYLEVDHFMDMLAKAIPGQIDDAILGAIKGAIK